MEIEAVRRENVKRPGRSAAERALAADFNDRGILTSTARGAQLVRSTFKIDERLSELAKAVCPAGALDQQAFCEEVREFDSVATPLSAPAAREGGLIMIRARINKRGVSCRSASS